MILDDKYTVTTDAFQWVLTKTVINAKTGKSSVKQTYFPSLKLALKDYLDESIKNDTAEEILASIIRVEKKIDNLEVAPARLLQLNNLAALVSGDKISVHQRADAVQEFNQVLKTLGV